MDALSGARVSIPTAALLFWLCAPFLDWSGWQWRAVGIYALVGFFFPAAVTLLTFEANRRMGPTVAGTIGSAAPLFAVLGAAAFLGELPRPARVGRHVLHHAGVDGPVESGWRGHGRRAAPGRALAAVVGGAPAGARTGAHQGGPRAVREPVRRCAGRLHGIGCSGVDGRRRTQKRGIHRRSAGHGVVCFHRRVERPRGARVIHGARYRTRCISSPRSSPPTRSSPWRSTRRGSSASGSPAASGRV